MPDDTHTAYGKHELTTVSSRNLRPHAELAIAPLVSQIPPWMHSCIMKKEFSSPPPNEPKTDWYPGNELLAFLVQLARELRVLQPTATQRPGRFDLSCSGLSRKA